MLVSAIAAIGKRGQIGMNGTIPWRCREDMLDFKKHTTGCAMLAGSSTIRSLPKKFFDSLPETGRSIYEWRPSCGNSDDAILTLQKLGVRHLWIIGGAYTYLHFHRHINHEVRITKVSYDNDPQLDYLHTFFPTRTYGL